MKKILITTVLFSAAGLMPILYLDATTVDPDKVVLLAIGIGFVLLVLAIISTILFAFEKTRSYGKAALLSIGIVLLVGFFVCSKS